MCMNVVILGVRYKLVECGRVLINRIRDKTENVIAEVQGGFRRGRGCTDQIFIVRQI